MPKGIWCNTNMRVYQCIMKSIPGILMTSKTILIFCHLILGVEFFDVIPSKITGIYFLYRPSRYANAHKKLKCSYYFLIFGPRETFSLQREYHHLLLGTVQGFLGLISGHTGCGHWKLKAYLSKLTFAAYVSHDSHVT